MLEILRKSTSGWIAKFLIGILAISFLFWGVEDVFRGYRQGELAKIGNITVANNAFERAYRREIEQVSRQFGRRLTQEQARMFGIDQRTLDNLVGSAAIDNHATASNLGIPEKNIVEDVRSTPAFKGVGGTFDRNAFNNFLRQVGLSEKSYAELRSKELLRTHLTSALLYGVTPPPQLIALIHRYRGEQRTVEHFTISPKKLPKIDKPTAEQLTKYYNDNKPSFVRPEYRNLHVVLATTDALKDRTKVADEEVKKTYEATKSQYNEPERRRIQQIAFKTKTDAERARKELTKGKSFVDVAKANGANETDINLGLLEKSDLIDPKIADAAFKLKKNAVSKPVEGKFGTVLVKVSAITPSVTRTYDDVKDIIRTNLQRTRARAEAQKAHDVVDNERLSGKSLKEIAAAAKLKFIEIPAIDKSAKTPDPKKEIKLPDLPALVAAAFQSEVGLENELLQSSDGGYIWYDVRAITPDKQKEFTEVKADVEKQWRRAQTQKALTKMAADLVKKADGGTPMNKLGRVAGGKLKTSKPVRRTEQGGGISQRTISRAFALPKAKGASVLTDDGKSRVVFKVTKITEPKSANPVQEAGIKEQLLQGMRTDTVAGYVAALKKRFPVTINRQAYDRLTGRVTTPAQNIR